MISSVVNRLSDRKWAEAPSIKSAGDDWGEYGLNDIQVSSKTKDATEILLPTIYEGTILNGKFTIENYLREDNHAYIYSVNGLRRDPPNLEARVYCLEGLTRKLLQYRLRNIRRYLSRTMYECRHQGRTIIVYMTDGAGINDEDPHRECSLVEDRSLQDVKQIDVVAADGEQQRDVCRKENTRIRQLERRRLNRRKGQDSGRIESSNVNASKAKAKIPLTSLAKLQTFHLFPDLPTKLRLSIWDQILHLTRPAPITIAIAPCRLIPLSPERTSSQDQNPQIWEADDRILHHGQPIPVILHVCHESRRVGLNEYVLGFEISEELRALTFDQLWQGVEERGGDPRITKHSLETSRLILEDFILNPDLETENDEDLEEILKNLHQCGWGQEKIFPGLPTRRTVPF